jgi:AcrR family transcriptional regulator
VTPRIDLPREDHVREVMAEVIADARENGRRPAVVTLARELGMSHPSFWRHFPGIARELVDLARSQGTERSPGAEPSRLGQIEEDNARLRRENTQLACDLRLAKAVIQRLALENDRQRRELEAAGKVVRIHPRNSVIPP